MPWEVELTDTAEDWYVSLSVRDQRRIAVAIDRLSEHGPGLRRPTVGSIRTSRHANMKELRSYGGKLRVLFAFDPRRAAIVLLGGDKTDDWVGWYERNVPIADDLYDEYLAEIRSEGLI
jgi:hypothetical protein